MSLGYAWLMLLVMSVVFLIGLVYVAIVAPWFAAIAIIVVTFGAVLAVRDLRSSDLAVRDEPF